MTYQTKRRLRSSRRPTRSRPIGGSVTNLSNTRYRPSQQSARFCQQELPASAAGSALRSSRICRRAGPRPPAAAFGQGDAGLTREPHGFLKPLVDLIARSSLHFDRRENERRGAVRTRPHAGAIATRDLGRVGIGLGLILIALQHLLTMITPYEDVPSLRMLLGAVTTDPLIDILLAAGLTWAAHSSVAVVLLIMAFAAQGVVPPHAAFALMLGATSGRPERAARKRSRRGPRRQAPADRQPDQSRAARNSNPAQSG